mmetsp:Transcript_101130/g.326416  ORF Transcript_101130/g.326416 Transcript_101130/m.326416 type:complete len:448 (+) Transcript_101130:123-1466(+)
MNGPSARALREGGIGGSIPYKIGVTLTVKLSSGGPLPPEWRKKTTLQEPFGDYGQILRIDCQEAQGVAFIEFEDKRDAEDAETEMNGKQILGKTINVTLTRAIDQRRAGVGPGRSIDIEERISELARRHRLDEAATARLASVFHDRSRLGCDLSRDFEELNEHLAASNKPSALVSMKLADLRAGRAIGPCKYAGSGARRGMCEADELPLLGSGSAPREGRAGEGHGREELRGRDERRQRSRERCQQRRSRECARSGSRQRDKSRPRKASPQRSRDQGHSTSRQREKARKQKLSAKQGREAAGSASRHDEKSRERKDAPRSPARSRGLDQGSARSRSGHRDRKPHEHGGGGQKKRAASSSSSRQQEKKTKASKPQKKQKPRSSSCRRHKKTGSQSSTSSGGKAGQKRPCSSSSGQRKSRNGNQHKKAQLRSPSARRCKKTGSSSSDSD